MTNEEKLNYLKNKISMELKNTDTQQGFEIICKRLSEFEKENAELKEQIENMKLEADKKLYRVHKQLEEILKLAKDKGIIKNWYYNGNYKWELTDCQIENTQLKGQLEFDFGDVNE